MGFWADIDLALLNGEPLCEAGKRALAEWLKQAGIERGLKYLRRAYKKSLKTIREVEEMAREHPLTPCCSECGDALTNPEDRERGVCYWCWLSLYMEEEDWREKIEGEK